MNEIINAIKPETPQSALLYARVSTAKQKAEGFGLESQEHRCREYARMRGYEVEAVFPDDASSGGDFMNRPGMKARLEKGYYVWNTPPRGLKYEAQRGEGKVLVRDEPLASILQEALEGYACGRFQTQVEVKRFLESQPLYPKDLPDGTIRNQRIHHILTNPT